MNDTSSGNLMAHAEQWIREVYYRRGELATAVPLTPDTDLIGSAILDSVAFLELLAFIEKIGGAEVDLDAADPASLTTIRSVCSPPVTRLRAAIDVRS